MSFLTAFKAQLYHQAKALVSKEVARKKLGVVQNTVNSMLAGMAAQLAQRALDMFKTYCLLEALHSVIHSYLKFNPAVIQFRVLL